MSRSLSFVSGKPYGLASVCRVWRLARSGVYRHQAPPPDTPPARRGPTGPMACWRPAPSMEKVTARSGRDCATPELGPRCAGCCG